MLARRLLSAAVGIPLLVLVIWAGGRSYDIVLALVLAAATAEFLHQAGLSPSDPLLWLTAATAGGLPLVIGARPEWTAMLLTAFLALSLVATLRFVSAGVFERWSLGVAVALYVGWLGRYWGLLRHGSSGRDWVLFVLLVTFASDTAAYATGRLLGRHRLAPRISPAKTVEGAVGGLAGATLVALLAGGILGLAQAPLRLLILGLLVSVAAQLGDLCESALKRRLDVKDAGWLLPGHGGLLDRLDSLLFAGAVVYYAVQWMSL
ncbi:MAG TPA: CDP-archaeol synthase [Dehalococcoidia bacterium]|nr:CDP-archaeol synthase [Dehalococcoidia bacterium]